MNVREVSDAVLARLQSMTWPPVFEAEEAATKIDPAPNPGYAIFHPSAGSIERDRLAAIGSRFSFPFTVVCAGTTRRQVQGVVTQVRQRLIGWAPDSDSSTDPITEIPIEAPLLTDYSDPSDIRLSNTLQFTTATKRS
jgi:hypothetical protein